MGVFELSPRDPLQMRHIRNSRAVRIGIKGLFVAHAVFVGIAYLHMFYVTSLTSPWIVFDSLLYLFSILDGHNSSLPKFSPTP